MEDKKLIITKSELGDMFHKYLNPLYEDMKELKKRVDGVESIQLRMEHKLDENIKMLHDRDDAHDHKINNHEKRISSLEKLI